MNRTIVCAFGALVLAACTTHESQAAKEASTPAPTAQPAPAPDAFPPLRSQQEADAQAAQAISKQNADAELEKLKKELSGGE